MRVSTAHFTQQNIQQMARLGAQAAKTQLQVASGRRIQVPSDDPLGSAQMLRLQEQIATRATYLANLDSADTQLSLEDGVLAQATDVLQRVTELTLQAGDPALGQSDREFLAVEILHSPGSAAH
jgi:flagellar hook-associated protein 3 FlgL